jgi:hypothetical protein
VAGEERRCDHRKANRKEALARELSHRCDDDRHAVEPAAPYLEICRVAPSQISLVEIVESRGFGSRRLRLIPRVAFAELKVSSVRCKAGAPNATSTGADPDLESPDTTQCSTTDRNDACQLPHPVQERTRLAKERETRLQRSIEDARRIRLRRGSGRAAKQGLVPRDSLSIHNFRTVLFTIPRGFGGQHTPCRWTRRDAQRFPYTVHDCSPPTTVGRHHDDAHKTAATMPAIINGQPSLLRLKPCCYGSVIPQLRAALLQTR